MKILVLDDQPTAMMYWWDALVDAGYAVVRCSTPEEAVRHYNAEHFDLIVLDRMMPPGEIFGKNTDPPSKETGSQVLKDFHDRDHLQLVPVIILTNYPDDQTVEQIKKDYERLIVVSKRTKPSEFVPIVSKMIQARPEDLLPPRIPDDEYPDIAPYFIQDVDQKKDVRVYFVRCSHEEKFASSPDERWDFAPVFENWLSNRETCSRVHKLLCHDHHESRTVGLYWSGREKGAEEWYRDILFVAAPWIKHGTDNRPLKGVGEVMVARYLREWLWRHDILPEEPEFDSSLFNDAPDLEGAVSAIPFLEAVGFHRVPGTKLYRISQDAAQELLNRVTRFERGPSRRSD